MQFIGANSQVFKFKFTNNGTNVDIGWDWNLGDGAGLALRSSSASSGTGGFTLYARNNTTNEYALKGTVDGTLTWNTNPVIVSGDDARKIWVTTSSSVPQGAVDNDIVLVKV